MCTLEPKIENKSITCIKSFKFVMLSANHKRPSHVCANCQTWDGEAVRASNQPAAKNMITGRRVMLNQGKQSIRACDEKRLKTKEEPSEAGQVGDRVARCDAMIQPQRDDKHGGWNTEERRFLKMEQREREEGREYN